MNNKTYLIAIFTFIINCFMVSGLIGETGKQGATTPEKKKVSTEYVAFYFHGNFRCANCRKIEQYSREAIEKYFAEQLKNKTLVFNVVNIDLPENKHFIDDYQLYTRSLIIAEFKEGKQVRWQNLSGVWNYLNNKDAFYDYVRSEIQKYLESS